MEAIAEKITQILPLSESNLETLQASPAWNLCGDLLVMCSKLEDIHMNDDAKFIKSRIKNIICQVVDVGDIEYNPDVYNDSEFVEAVSKAKEFGWSEEELTKTSTKYTEMSLAQLFVPGSEIVSIDKERIRLKTPSGFTQNVWRYSKYK